MVDGAVGKDVFLSYAREDAARAEQLAHALEARGWSVFWDVAVAPGRRWRDEIYAELVAAKSVVVLWSQRAVKSVWVEEEATVAREFGKLLPARIDSADPPFGFRHIEAANLGHWAPGAPSAEFEGLVQAIASTVGDSRGSPTEPRRQPRGRTSRGGAENYTLTDDDVKAIWRDVAWVLDRTFPSLKPADVEWRALIEDPRRLDEAMRRANELHPSLEPRDVIVRALQLYADSARKLAQMRTEGLSETALARHKAEKTINANLRRL